MRLHSLLATLALLAACGGGKSRAVQPPDPPPEAPAPRAPMTLAESGIVDDWIDRSADPCVDFFEYACGGFVATAEIPADRASWSAIQIVVQETEELLREILEDAAKDPQGDPLRQALGDYYAACMDEPAIEAAGIEPLEDALAAIAKVKDARTAYAAIGTLHAGGIYPFFSLGPYQDFADATQVIAFLDQDGLGLPDRDYYLKNDAKLKELRAAYQAHVGRMFGLLGVEGKARTRAVADVIRIETALARLHQDKVTRRDPYSVYHRIDRAGLEQAAPKFPWGAYLAALGIPDVTAISVNEPAYYKKVVGLIGKEKPAALRNYLTWMVVQDQAQHLTQAFVDEQLALARLLSGVKELPPRWRRCVQRVDADLGELLGQPYVREKFAGDSKARAVEMTRAVFAAMDARLDTLPWMDDATRAAARQKLEKMAYLIGYPDVWRAYDFAIRRDDFAGNVAAATRFELARQMAKIGKPVDRNEWQMTAPTVNAYYDSTLNEIALPAGQLQPPFFGAGFHPAVNFGSTGGGTIGHEMTHGFDDEGSQFDADGNLRSWWTESTRASFDAATACVVEQYGGYEAVPGVKLDGKLTSGENIADIGGVKLGFEAYRAWRDAQPAGAVPVEVGDFSDEQLYFLAYAQSWCSKDTPERLETMARTNPHSPPRWRVDGVIVDQPEFGEVWRCEVGTPMNPAERCEVW